MSQVKAQRILALDILRGITTAGMILVNNPGSWSHIYAPLKHAEWIGLTPTDLIFPFFMFIMGISTYISLRKYQFEFRVAVAKKVLKRTIVIFLVGSGIVWLSTFCGTGNAFDFSHFRILGVLQRLAICYGVVVITALLVKYKNILYLIIALLVGYFIILQFGNGFVYDETNVLSVVDCAVLGNAHIYNSNCIDPEGLLSTLPSIAHVLIGFMIGKMLFQVTTIQEKIERLFILGTILTFSGFLLSYGCPISKQIWSPTFVLVTCGLASSLLVLLIWIIDVKGFRQWSRFFESFGVNPLFVYVMADILSIMLNSIYISFRNETISLHGFVYKIILQPLLGDYLSSLVFALLFVGLNWSIGYILYKRKIYIKI